MVLKLSAAENMTSVKDDLSTTDLLRIEQRWAEQRITDKQGTHQKHRRAELDCAIQKRIFIQNGHRLRWHDRACHAFIFQ
jgi:hypothetical protein